MGFFELSELKSNTGQGVRFQSCASCGLYKTVKSPKMKPFGNMKKGILNIGEAPGGTEDEKGKQWQGKMGKVLENMYGNLGIDLFEDCLNINAVNCRPMDKSGNNRAPTPEEIGCCRKMVIETIRTAKPNLIVLLGSAAVESIIGSRWKKDLGGIGKWHGWRIPDREFNAWICPVYHPSFVQRAEEGATKTIWKTDLKTALSYYWTELPSVVNERTCVVLTSDLKFLENPPNLVAIDYETTGLKPHSEGHQIVCAAIAVSETVAYSFLLPDEQARKPLIKLLANPRIKKMAHNIKFEEAWSVARLGQSVKNWHWDSMQAAHLLDNRPDITGLKFQTYVNFGEPDYDSEVEPYIKTKNKDGNAKNRIMELVATAKGRARLLEYCGLDALFEYRLAKRQMEAIGVKTEY